MILLFVIVIHSYEEIDVVTKNTFQISKSYLGHFELLIIIKIILYLLVPIKIVVDILKLEGIFFISPKKFVIVINSTFQDLYNMDSYYYQK